MDSIIKHHLRALEAARAEAAVPGEGKDRTVEPREIFERDRPDTRAAVQKTVDIK